MANAQNAKAYDMVEEDRSISIPRKRAEAVRQIAEALEMVESCFKLLIEDSTK